MSEQPMQEKKHYHLIYGEVIYVRKDAPERIQALDLNACLITDKREVSSTNLAEAQATLQQGLELRIDRDLIEVKDAIIKSLTWLGEMTVNEFAGSDILAEARKAADAAAKAK